MQLSDFRLSKRLSIGAAILSLAAVLSACSDDNSAEKAKDPATTEIVQSGAATPAATPEAKPAVGTAGAPAAGTAAATPATTPAKPAAAVKMPEPEGSVDIAKLMAPGPLPEVALGKAGAPVTIVEYMSMTCPHCARFHNDVFEPIKAKYVDSGKVRFVLREFPLDVKATAAIMLARCAPPEQYFPLVSVLFKQQMGWATADDTRGALLQIGKLVGFTQESFEACLTNQKLLDDVTAVRTKADKEFGVQSTPTFFINGKRYSGEMSVEEMSAVIDAAS